MRSLVLLLVWSVLTTAAAAADLAGELARLVATVPRGGEAGVAVYDLHDGRWLFRHQADRPRALASTTKILVAAAALSELGAEFRFLTHVHGLGPVSNGAVPGLGVVGGGDPCLDGHFTDDDPDQVFVAWAAKLKAQGIRRIDGDLVIDNRLFSGPARPATYPQDANNLTRWYSAPASAFAWNDNCISVRVVPTRVGEPAEVQVRPRSPRVRVTNQTRTVAGKGDREMRVNRSLDGNAVTVGGNFSQGSAWFDVAIADDPDLLAGDQLKTILAREGIPLSGTVRIGAIDTATAPLLVEHASPLVPAVTLMNQHSQNFYGEQLLRMLGFVRHRDGSIASGTKAVGAILHRLIGDRADAVTLLDGCGLSYGNAGSAEALVEVLAAMHRSVRRDDFYQSLRDTRDDRRLPNLDARVKTGTLAIATCLVGYINRPDGHRLAFALLFNKGESRDFSWAPKLRDRLFRTLGEG